MAFQYTIVFGFLLLEMLLFAVISLPLPPKIRRPLLEAINKPFHSPQFQIFFKCVLGFIFILFVDALNRMNRITSELHGIDAGTPGPGGVPPQAIGSRTEIQSRRFYDQRNVYLCGLTLFLAIVVNRTYALVFELLEVKEKIAGVNSQAELDDLDLTDGKDVKKLEARITDREDELARLRKQAAAIDKDYPTPKKEAAKPATATPAKSESKKDA